MNRAPLECAGPPALWLKRCRAPTPRGAQTPSDLCLLGLGFCICVGLVAIHIRIRVCNDLELVLYALNAVDRFDCLVGLRHLGLICDRAGKRNDAVINVNIDR